MRIAAALLATLLAVAALGLGVPAAAGNGAVHGPSRCTAQKLKAFGVYQQQIAGCRSKAVAKGEPTDGVCVAKAEDKLRKVFEKAEKKADCLEVRDASFAIRHGADYLDRAATILENHPICCESSSFECNFVTAEEECTAISGTIGSIGSVCGPAGDCVAPPSPPTDCCAEVPGTLGTGCVTGLVEDDCAGLGGSHVPEAICTPTGSCIFPK
jgi:hypothetical protein